MPSIKDWISAARLRTLPLALAGMIIGNVLAYDDAHFSWPVALLSLLTAVLLQVLSNYANDLGDTENGADNELRVGPQRAVQSGKISIQQMKVAVILFAATSFLSGCLLLWVAREAISIEVVLSILVAGLLSILAAYTYTASKNPYGYRALGDLAVFLFFGLLAVLGSYVLQTGTLKMDVWAFGAGMGCLSTAVLNLNNMRDLKSDAAANKMTVALLLGLSKAKVYHYSLCLMGVLFFGIFSSFRFETLSQYVFLTPLVLVLGHCIKVNRRSTFEEFNPLLKELSLSSALIALSLGIGFLLK